MRLAFDCKPYFVLWALAHWGCTSGGAFSPKSEGHEGTMQLASGKLAADGMAIQEDVGGVEGDVVARHVPDATILASLAP